MAMRIFSFLSYRTLSFICAYFFSSLILSVIAQHAVQRALRNGENRIHRIHIAPTSEPVLNALNFCLNLNGVFFASYFYSFLYNLFTIKIFVFHEHKTNNKKQKKEVKQNSVLWFTFCIQKGNDDNFSHESENFSF